MGFLTATRLCLKEALRLVTLLISGFHVSEFAGRRFITFVFSPEITDYLGTKRSATMAKWTLIAFGTG